MLEILEEHTILKISSVETSINSRGLMSGKIKIYDNNENLLDTWSKKFIELKTIIEEHNKGIKNGL